MKLKIFDKDSHKDYGYLSSALVKFQDEVYKENTVIDIDYFVDSHYAIYLIENNDGDYVGFSSFTINSYFTLRSPTIGNTFIFIEKEYRNRSKAMHLISIQAGMICRDTGYPLEHYIVDGSGSEKFVGRLNGKKIYTTYEFSQDEVSRETSRLISKVKIKDV